MAYEKVVEARIWDINGVSDSTRQTSAGAISQVPALTAAAHPMRGAKFWDRAVFVVNGVSLGGDTGTYTIQLEGTVNGVTGLPISSLQVDADTAPTAVMDNLHDAPGTIIPDAITITEDLDAGTGLFCEVHVAAKQYRGSLRNSPNGAGTKQRSIEGFMFQSGRDLASDNLNGDVTMTLGTSGNAMGLDRMRLWDNAQYWVVNGETTASTYTTEIVGEIGGATHTIVSVAGLNAAGEKLALAGNMHGASPNPTQIIFTETGASDGLSDVRVIVAAKSGRGTLAG
jgi:hypothetical protein